MTFNFKWEREQSGAYFVYMNLPNPSTNREYLHLGVWKTKNGKMWGWSASISHWHGDYKQEVQVKFYCKSMRDAKARAEATVPRLIAAMKTLDGSVTL